MLTFGEVQAQHLNERKFSFRKRALRDTTSYRYFDLVLHYFSIALAVTEAPQVCIHEFPLLKASSWSLSRNKLNTMKDICNLMKEELQ